MLFREGQVMNKASSSVLVSYPISNVSYFHLHI